MNSLFAIGTVALMSSSVLAASEIETRDCIALAYETLSLSDLLLHVQDTAQQLVAGEDETCLVVYHELKESLKVVYALNSLHPNEAAAVQQALDESYAAVADAVDNASGKIDILRESLKLFTMARFYDQEAGSEQSLQDWTEATTSEELKSVMEAADADIVYIQDAVSWNVREDVSRHYAPPRLLYSANRSTHSTPNVLIIKNKSNDSPEYEVEGGVKMKLGGKDHGKVSGYVGGQIKDKKGNYASGKVTKEKGDDGYECEVNAGKVKKNK